MQPVARRSNDPHPSFAEGLSVQRVLAAVGESSARDSVWVGVPADVTVKG